MSFEKYLELPYTIVLKKDEDGDYVALVKELPGCVAHGSTLAEAFDSVESMKALWIKSCIADGKDVPLPEKENGLPSGKWLQRVPRSLHAALTKLAENDGVSLNQFVVAVLSKEVGVREHQKVVVTLHAAARASVDLWVMHSDAGSRSWQLPLTVGRRSQTQGPDTSWLMNRSHEEKGVIHGKGQEDAHQYCH